MRQASQKARFWGSSVATFATRVAWMEEPGEVALVSECGKRLRWGARQFRHPRPLFGRAIYLPRERQ
jgi:hypothetical protein